MAWLEKTWAQRNSLMILKNEVRQLGPNKIRNKEKLERALTILGAQGKIVTSHTPAEPGKKPVHHIYSPRAMA